MKQKLFSIALSFLLIATTAVSLPSTVQAQTQAWSGNCVADSTGAVGSGDVATIQGLECLIANVFSVALTGIGLAGFVMLLVGAFRYLISGGNSKGTETARNTLTFAIVGLVVALSAFIILNLVAQFTGVQTILQFRIPIENNGGGGGGSSGTGNRKFN